VDPQKRITGVNQEFCQLTGFTEEEMIGNTCHTFFVEQCEAKCALCSPDCSEDIIKIQSNVSVHREGHNFPKSRRAGIR
jgi:PAS domain S-box-containing protein